MNYREELRYRQDRFTRHVGYLISFVHTDTDLTLSFGDAWRTVQQQEIYVKAGVSQTMDSMHLKRLGIDLNFFLDDYYLFSDKNKKEQDFKLIEPVGEYWETLDKDNVWGGRWKFYDPYHFENKF